MSVVIPTFNRAALLRETLDAVLGQSVPPDEVIVVDDGSTDGTQGMLAGFGTAVTAIRSPNGGDMVARNLGLRAATGELVAFCDSDDLWERDYLAALGRCWGSAPELTATYANFRELRGGELAPRAKFDAAPPGFWTGAREVLPGFAVFDAPIVAQLLDFQPLFPSGMTVHRERFTALGGWDEGVSRMVGCDFATALRVAAAPPVGVLHRPLVRIRKHAGNISADTEAMNLGDARVLQHVLDTRPELAGIAAAIRASIARRRLAALDSAFARRDFAHVREISRLVGGAPRTWRHHVKGAIARFWGVLARPG